MEIDYRIAISKLNSYLAESKNKTIFTVAITVLLLVFLLILGILPAYSSLSIQKLDNEKRDLLIAMQKQKIADLKLLSQDSQNSSTVVDYLNFVMPSIVDQEILITFFNDLVASSNINLVEIAFNNNVDTNSLVINNINLPASVLPLGVNIVVQGNREGIVNLIKTIEASTRLMDIISFQITKKTEDDIKKTFQLGEYNATIGFFLYNWEAI